MSNGSTEHWVKQGVPEPVAKTLAGRARDVARHPATLTSGSTIGALLVAFQLLGDRLPSKETVEKLEKTVQRLEEQTQKLTVQVEVLDALRQNEQWAARKRYE